MPRKNQMIGLMELAWNRCSGDINTIIHYSIGVALGLLFISVPGVMRGHVKTPSFMTGMKCLPHRQVIIMLDANNCMRPIERYIYQCDV